MLLGIMPIQKDSTAAKGGTYTARFDPAVLEKLREMAQVTRMDISEILRFAVDEILELSPEELAKRVIKRNRTK